MCDVPDYIDARNCISTTVHSHSLLIRVIYITSIDFHSPSGVVFVHNTIDYTY